MEIMNATPIPRPEYPRPQFARSQWINLNGQWEFELDLANTAEERGIPAAAHLSQTITVPFCPESKLSGIGNKEFMDGVCYKKKVQIPDEWLQSGDRVFIHIGACDYYARVFVNGKFAGHHYGGFTPFGFDITDHCAPGETDITVLVSDHTRDTDIPSGKQCADYQPDGCFYTRTTGIWQTVWLERVPKTHLKHVKITPSLVNKTVTFEADAVCGAGATFVAEIYFAGKLLTTASAVIPWRTVTVSADLPEVHPWCPETPDLYDVIFRLGEDKVESYFGLRDIAFVDGKFFLNGKSVFQRLVLDQGYYPDGVYTAPTEEDLIRDIQISMDIGFNGARLHQKIFEPRFLYHCDRMGYLVWGEYPNWGMDVSSDCSYRAMLQEWSESLIRDYNHPSIVGWCPLNETPYNVQPRLAELLYHMTLSYDATRVFIDNSGWKHVDGCYDMYDTHDYCGDPEEFRKTYEPLIEGKAVPCVAWQAFPDGHYCRKRIQSNEICFISEFGGIRLKEEKEEHAWGYGEALERDQLVEKYIQLCKAMLDNPKICAYCYTQLTDVEQEQNGLYTFSREAKFDAAKIKAAVMEQAAVEGITLADLQK